jgi:hypothetical protein
VTADQTQPSGESHRSFTSPHIQAFDGACYLLEHLAGMTRTVHALVKEVEAQGGDPEGAMIVDVMERQAVAEAVHVFCAITVEGAVNLQCVAMFDEHLFHELERRPVAEKLSRIFEFLPKRPSEELTGELLALAKDLYDARNDFVHPKPQKGSSEGRPWRARNYQEAARAVASTHRFLMLMVQLDHRNGAFFFRPWRGR